MKRKHHFDILVAFISILAIVGYEMYNSVNCSGFFCFTVVEWLLLSPDVRTYLGVLVYFLVLFILFYFIVLTVKSFVVECIKHLRK